MRFCWFALFHNPTAPEIRLREDEISWLSRVVAKTPSLRKAIIFTPAQTSDPYLDDGPPPQLSLQLYFEEIEALEAALAPQGHLQIFAMDGALPSLARATVCQQAMLVRRFPVPDPTFRTSPGELPCTYLVAYQGTAEDLNAWHTHYIADHPPIMARFPGIRQIEVYTRIDWCGSLPWPRVDYMQRNKVVFDSPAALTEALNSPVRHEMRAAFHGFPPFAGPITHFPMETVTVLPECP